MATNNIPGLPLAFVIVGGVLVWSGIENVPVTDVFRVLATGKMPPKGPPEQFATPAVAGSSSTTVPITATGSSIANDALRYQGHPYIYGGAPGPNGTSGWDCSSFCSWVLGHDLGMTLPGNSSPGYAGTSHGPNTVSYLGWSGAETVGHSGSASQAGDLCVWQTHMGIAIGNGQMISAQTEATGTQVSGIDHFIPEFLFVRRIVLGSNRG